MMPIKKMENKTRRNQKKIHTEKNGEKTCIPKCTENFPNFPKCHLLQYLCKKTLSKKAQKMRKIRCIPPSNLGGVNVPHSLTALYPKNFFYLWKERTEALMHSVQLICSVQEHHKLSDGSSHGVTHKPGT